MEIKPDIVKTITRLSSQGKNDVLKNKLRAWLQTRDFTLDDLFFNCNEGTIRLSSGLLNKMGTLYSSGKEGLNEDNEAAFAFFEMASELGHSGACGNCAQYYFDGRAPEGKDIEMAQFYCMRAIELGLDKYMLMGEINYDQNKYADAVKWMHMMLDNKTVAKARKIEARSLERQCLHKQLNRVFHKLNTVIVPGVLVNITMESLRTADQSKPGTPSRGLLALARAKSLTPKSSKANLLAGLTPTPGEKGRARSPTSASAAAVGNNSTSTSAAALSASMQRLQVATNTKTEVLSAYDLPGWFRISDDIDGFDRNSCTALTARAEMLELEAHAVRAACDTAQEHVQQARRNNMSEDIISLLIDTKVREFKEIYAGVVANKEFHIACWDAYTDTQEQIIRRQLNAEQAFFNPRTCANRLTPRLAERLLKKRTYDEQGDGATEPFVLNLASDELDGTTLYNRIPTARCIITAERSLLELAADIYAPKTYTLQASGANNSNANTTSTGTTTVQLRYTGWTLPESASSSSSAFVAVVDTAEPAPTAAATPSKRSVTPLKISTSTESPVKSSSQANAGNTATISSGDSNGATKEPVGELTPTEDILIDSTHVYYRCRSSVPLVPTVKNLHQSNFLAEDVGNSDEVLSFFNKLTMVAEDPVYVENEKILVQMIIRFAHDGRPILLKDLQLLNPECIEQDKMQMDRVCFHYFVRRVIKWVMPVEDEAHKQLMLPIASVQGRALQLIEAGIITLAEAFDKDGLYGIFYCDERAAPHSHHHAGEHAHYPHFHQHNHNHLTTTLHKGHGQFMSLHHTTSSQHVPPLSALRNKVKHINALYQKYIVELQAKNFLPTIQFWKVHTTGATVPSYRLLYTELSKMYGGESDDGADVNTVCNHIAAADRAMHDMLQKLQS